jgi:sugar phosphate isomerase/epimerase
MLLGYNTNGFAHHDPLEAIELLADIGYRSVAITLDHGRLNPFAPEFDDELRRVRRLLERRGLRSVIETGARYLLDPRVKHEPTLVSVSPEGRARRLDFLRRAVLAAAALESDCVSIWSGIWRSGANDGLGDNAAIDRLADGLQQLCAFAAAQNVRIGFEPEPGMLIDTQRRFAELLARHDLAQLALTLDIGHLHCEGETPIADEIHRWKSRLVNVHVEDMRAGVHEHLMFGEGEIDFPPVFAALAEIGYQGGVHVELSRHSHDAPRAAEQAFAFLAPLVAAHC